MTQEIPSVIYTVYNGHTKSYYRKDVRNPKGYTWAGLEEAMFFRGESSRGKAFNIMRRLKQDNGYSDYKVRKFQLQEIEDR